MAVTPTISVHRLDRSRVADFYALHCPAHDAGWCHCVAWWVPGWDGWPNRTAEQNRALRDELLGRGEFDGYLLYRDDEPVGWCQCGLRDRLPNLIGEFGFDPDPEVWAITCFLIAPRHRREGLMRRLLGAVLDDLRARGATRVEAYPKPAGPHQAGALWTGPEQVFVQAGFEFVRRGSKRCVYVKRY